MEKKETVKKKTKKQVKTNSNKKQQAKKVTKKVEKDNKKKKIIHYIVEVIFIILILISVFKIFIWWKDNHKSKKILKETSKNVEVIKDESGEDTLKVDFASLKKQNSDTVAYLKVNGTNIDYPLVKTTNNEYYLFRSFDKTYNEAGWPFINFQNKLDGTDKNISIFGHARLDGSMFGTLKDTLNETWQSDENNFKVTFITENEESTYQVFSTYKIKVEDYYINADFISNNEFDKFIKTLKSRSNKDYGIEVSGEDQIITLSTCDINNDYRIVMHAKKVN